MKITKQARREAKQLFRICLVNGLLDENRARQRGAASRRCQAAGLPGHPLAFSAVGETGLAPQHTARVESAMPLAADLQASVQAESGQRYGRG